MRAVALMQGRVYAAKFPHVDEEKYYLVVSNNRRNRQLPQAVAVRLTTSPRPALRSVVELDATEAFCGRVLCDDIEQLYPDEVTRDMGALTPAAMDRVGDGLRAALDL